jgi:hypothetical protein
VAGDEGPVAADEDPGERNLDSFGKGRRRRVNPSSSSRRSTSMDFSFYRSIGPSLSSLAPGP